MIQSLWSIHLKIAVNHSEQQSISIQRATLQQRHLNQALTEAIDSDSEELQRQQPESVQNPEPPETSDQQLPKDISQGEQDIPSAVKSEEPQRQDKEALKELEPPESSQQPISEAPIQLEQQQSEPPTELLEIADSFKPSLVEKPATSPSSRQAALLKTPLLPKYEHLTKSEAIENLLHEHSGAVLHVNYIIRALHGELTLEDVAAEKPRMNDSLKKGVTKGLWDKVPDFPDCYTADIKLIEKEVPPKNVESNKRQGKNPNSKATEGMLPRYRDLTFTDAVETVMRDRSGEIVTTDLMARSLYGELEGSALVEAKKKVGKIMWSGGSQGRWQSVPGQKGAYTLALATK